MTVKRCTKILAELERKGLVRRIWSKKKNGWVWGKTEFGKQVYKELQKQQTKKGKRT